MKRATRIKIIKFFAKLMGVKEIHVFLGDGKDGHLAGMLGSNFSLKKNKNNKKNLDKLIETITKIAKGEII